MSLLLALTGGAAPITITISDNTGATYSGVEGNGLREVSPNTNYWNDTSQPFFYQASSWQPGDRGHALLRFTGLSSVPTGGTVTNGKIRLNVLSIPSANCTIICRRLITSWSQTQSTWNQKSTGVNWGTAGALGAADISSTLTATLFINTAGAYVEFTGAQVDADIQDMIDNPSTNYGWYFQNQNDTAYNFSAINFNNNSRADGVRPSLEFDWVAAGGSNTDVAPNVGNITFTGYAPTVNQTSNISLDPLEGVLIFAGYAPLISQTNNQSIDANTGAFSFTGYAPDLIQTNNQFVSPIEGVITFSGFQPLVQQTFNQEIIFNDGAINFTGYAPSLFQTINQTILLETGLLTIEGYAPSINQTNNQTIEPLDGTLYFSGYVPSIFQTTNQEILINTGQILFTGYAPTVEVINTNLEYGKIQYNVAKFRNYTNLTELRNFIHIVKARNYMQKGQDMSFPAKAPVEKPDLGFDFSPLILSSQTIANAVINVTVEHGNALANTLTLIGGATVDGLTVIQRVGDGVIGTTYSIECVVTTSTGQVFNDVACISVIARQC